MDALDWDTIIVFGIMIVAVIASIPSIISYYSGFFTNASFAATRFAKHDPVGIGLLFASMILFLAWSIVWPRFTVSPRSSRKTRA